MPMVAQINNFFICSDGTSDCPLIATQVLPRLDAIIKRSREMTWGIIAHTNNRQSNPFSVALEAMRNGHLARFCYTEDPEDAEPWLCLKSEAQGEDDWRYAFYSMRKLGPNEPRDPKRDVQISEGWYTPEAEVPMEATFIACFNWEIAYRVRPKQQKQL